MSPHDSGAASNSVGGTGRILPFDCRPLLIALASSAAIVTFGAHLPAKWHLPSSDLRLQQALAFAVWGWSLLSAAVSIGTGQCRSNRAGSAAQLVVNLIVLATILVTASDPGAVGVAQQSWFLGALFCLVAGSAAAGSKRLLAGATIGAAALYLALPALQSLLGMASRPVAIGQQIVLVALIVAQGLMLGKLVGRQGGEHPSADLPAPERRMPLADLLLLLALVLPCVQILMIDMGVGLVAATASAAALRAIRGRARGADRAITIVLVACAGLVGIAFSLYTTARGFLLADSLIPRLAEELYRRYPALAAVWVSWGLMFVIVFLLADQLLRALLSEARPAPPDNIADTQTSRERKP